jgi:hypothetical protein
MLLCAGALHAAALHAAALRAAALRAAALHAAASAAKCDNVWETIAGMDTSLGEVSAGVLLPVTGLRTKLVVEIVELLAVVSVDQPRLLSVLLGFKVQHFPACCRLKLEALADVSMLI